MECPHIHLQFITILHCAGSTEEPHRIRESGENKSVVFKATVSYFIVGKIYTRMISRFQVAQGSLGIVWILIY